MFNKKNIAIIALIVVVAALVGIRAYTTYHNAPNGDLPVVAENTEPTTTAAPATVEPEDLKADAPSDGIDVSNVTDTETPAEADARDAALATQGPVAQDDAALKAADVEAKRTQDALDNPQPKTDPKKGEDEGVKIKVSTPTPTKSPSTTPAPKKDADGYIITKEQAVKDGAAALQHEIDTNGFAWSDGYKSMKEELGYTDEFIQSLIQKAKIDPYSSTALSDCYNLYRKDGDALNLAERIIAWICNGGNDTGYSGHGV